VPSPRRLLALVAQLNLRILGLGNPQEAQVFFCLWKEVLPQRLQLVWV